MSSDRRSTRTSTSIDGSRKTRIGAPELVALALLACAASAAEPAREDLTPRQQERLEQWQQLTPEQREAVRLQRDRFRALPPEERARLEQRHRRFQRLPPRTQQEIRDAYRASWRLSPDESRALRDCLRREADGEPVHCGAAPPGEATDDRSRTREREPVVPPPRLPR